MGTYNNPRLLNTVVSGSGMKHPVRPHVILGEESNGFIKGDLMDANAVKEVVKEESAVYSEKLEQLKTEITTEVLDALVGGNTDGIAAAIRQIVDAEMETVVNRVMNNPETPAIDSIQEIVEALDKKRDSEGEWFSVDQDSLVLNVN